MGSSLSSAASASASTSTANMTTVEVVYSADGTELYASATGDPSKPSIIFIHGLGLSGAVWNDIFATSKYSKDFYLVRYDVRGHGRSGKPDTMEGYESKRYAEDFATVLRAFNLRKPLVLGWSLGGTVMADVAAHLPPDTLAGIVYLDGLPYIGVDIMQGVGTPEILSLIPRLFDESRSLDAARSCELEFVDLCFAKYDHRLKRSLPPDDTSSINGATEKSRSRYREKLPHRYWETQCSWLGMGMQQSLKHRRFVLTRTQDPTALCALGARGLPVLVLCGKYDAHLDGEAVARELKNRGFTRVQLRLIEKGGSHSVHIENPEEVMSHLLKFAKSIMM